MRWFASFIVLLLLVFPYQTTCQELQPTSTPNQSLPSDCSDVTSITNVAALGIASSMNGLGNPEKALDGDISTYDSYWEAKDVKYNKWPWWQVKLPCELPIDRIEVYSWSKNDNGLYDDFDIAVSTTGLFNGEEQVVAFERNRIAKAVYKYEFTPVQARFIRLIPQSFFPYVRLQELRTYPALGSTPTPTSTIIYRCKIFATFCLTNT